VKNIAILTVLATRMVCGQDIVGDWQGILKAGKSEERVVVTIARNGRDGWSASECTPDDGSN